MSGEAPIPEVQRRLIYALLEPVVSLSRRFRLPLDALETLCRLAYFEELRRRAQATQSEVAEVFGMSLRTVVGVERQFRTDFLAPQYDIELSRRLEETLAEGEISAETLSERLSTSLEDVERALAGLVGAGRARSLERDGARYFVLSERYQSLVRDDLLARIDGLKHQLEVLVGTIRTRFLGDAEGLASVARTVSFVGSAKDVEEMADEVVREMRVRAIDVEEAALKGGSYDRYAVTIALAPTKEHLVA